MYDIRRNGAKIEGEAAGGFIDIVPGRNDVDLSRVHVGDRVWKTNDPHLDKQLRQTYETEKPYHVFPVQVKVTGALGQPLKSWWTDLLTGHTELIESELLLEQALKRPMDEAFFTEQFGRLGGTIYTLDKLDITAAG